MAYTELKQGHFHPFVPPPLATLLWADRNYPIVGGVWPTTETMAIRAWRVLSQALLERNPHSFHVRYGGLYKWLDKHQVWMDWRKQINGRKTQAGVFVAPADWPREVRKAFPVKVIPHPWLFANMKWSMWEDKMHFSTTVLMAYAHGMSVELLAEALMRPKEEVIKILCAGVYEFCSHPRRMLWLMNINWDLHSPPEGLSTYEKFQLRADPLRVSKDLAQLALEDASLFRLACAGGGGTFNIYTIQHFNLDYVQAPNLSAKDQKQISQMAAKLTRYGMTR